MPAQNAQPTPNSRPIPAAPMPRTSRRGFAPVFSPMQKSMLKGLVGLAVLSIGLVAVVGMAQYSRDDRTNAGPGGIGITLNGDTSTASINDTVTVSAIVTSNPSGNLIAAADFYFDYNPNVFEVVSYEVGPAFDATATNMYGNNPPQSLTGNVLYNGMEDGLGGTMDDRRFAVGAACDECELVGSNGGTSMVDCVNPDTNPPACHPPTAGQLITARFKVIGGEGTSATIGLVDPANQTGTMSQIAALSVDSSGNTTAINGNELGNVTTLSVAIQGNAQTNCQIADIVPNNKVDTADFALLVANFTGFGNCSGDQCVADIVPNNKVDTADFAFLVNEFTGFGFCQ